MLVMVLGHILAMLGQVFKPFFGQRRSAITPAAGVVVIVIVVVIGVGADDDPCGEADSPRRNRSAAAVGWWWWRRGGLRVHHCRVIGRHIDHLWIRRLDDNVLLTARRG